MYFKNEFTDNKMIKKPDDYHRNLTFNPAGMISALVVAFLLSTVLYSQPEGTTKVKERAIVAFSQGNYAKALDDFGQLLKIYPADPLYKYYYGVSMVKLERDPVSASSFLSEAMEAAEGIKRVPDDGWFYLGRARQMSGDFDRAVESFDTFSEIAGRKKAREFDTESFIRQCRNREGMKSFEQLIREGSGAESPEKKEVSLSSSRSVKPRDYLPEEDDRLLSEAFDRQARADSLQKIVTDSGNQKVQQPGSGQGAAGSRMAEAEKAASLNQQEADRIFSGIEKGKQTGSESEEPVAMTERGKIPAASSINAPSVGRPDEILQEPGGSTSLFGIIAGRTFSPAETIEINPAVPAGLVYRIQMAVFRNPVSPSIFRGISPVYGLKAEGTDITYYYAGYFRTNSDAQRALTLVRQEGMKDAFVVAVMDGKPVSQERAAVLEKEWGAIPFETATVRTAKPIPAKDDNPPELSFRVEITRSDKPLSEDVVEGYRTVSGKRGFEILASDDNKMVYLIGKFITFESAEEYAGLLIRNGYNNARVSAWLGKREIPLETAKQLFEMTE